MNNKWITILCAGLTVAAMGCKDDSSSGSIKTGESCKVEEYGATCDTKNNKLYCEDGFVQTTPCGGNTCFMGSCVPKCSSDAECTGAKSACAGGMCIEKQAFACTANDQCGDNGECLKGACYTKPHDAAGCSADKPCVKGDCFDGLCYVLYTPECDSDAQCKGGVCVNKMCYRAPNASDTPAPKPECTTNDECTDGKVCSAAGKCVENPGDTKECDSDNPCVDANKECINFECVEKKTCTENSECPEWQYCGSDGQCADIVCSNHSDCQEKASDWFCHDQKCVQAQCDAERPCTDSNKMCSEGLCIDKGFVACDANNACATGTCIAGACITEAMKPFAFRVTVRDIQNPVRLNKVEGIAFEIDGDLDTYTNSGAVIDCGQGQRVGSEMACQFTEPGDYEIKIYGNIDALYMCQEKHVGEHKTAWLLGEVKSWGNGQWKSLAGMFKYCQDVTITATDIPDFTAVRFAHSMFKETQKTTLPANMWQNTTAVDMTELFANAKDVSDNIKDWDTSHVTNMNSMFHSVEEMNIDLSQWNTQNVTNMAHMFYVCGAFNQNIGGWNTSKVTNMASMFQSAHAFNQPIGGWDTGNVTDMNKMFYDAKAFNQSLENWNTSNVTDMYSMFNGAEAFNQPLTHWDTSKVTSMNAMFHGAAAFNQDVKHLNITNVGFMSGFLADTAFDKDISGWLKGANVAALRDVSFLLPRAYNKPIRDWDLRGITSYNNMVGEEYPCASFTDIQWPTGQTATDFGCKE